MEILNVKTVKLTKQSWSDIDKISDYDIRTVITKMQFKLSKETVWYDKFHSYANTLSGWDNRLSLHIRHVKNANYKYEAYVVNRLDKSKSKLALINTASDLIDLVNICYPEYITVLKLNKLI